MGSVTARSRRTLSAVDRDPPRPAACPLPLWRDAWREALYGTGGFYRHQAPAQHFRTAAHGSDVLAGALATLARRHRLDSVVDVGAGRGELLLALRRAAPHLRLNAVEVAPRPVGLPSDITWSHTAPEAVEGLVLAHELLDTVPCAVAEVDPGGTPRLVHVDPRTGNEQLGEPLRTSGETAELTRWLDQWWPLAGATPGARAEVGLDRDRTWAAAVARLRRGLAVAVDYGHTRAGRPSRGSLRCYRHGREVGVAPDGTRDVTADVAVDAVAAAVEGSVLPQREALAALGVSARRPPLAEARSDPSGYLRSLASATAAAELLAPGGFGGFYWVVSGRGGVVPSWGSPDLR